MSLMIIKNSISVAIRGAIPDSENAKEYLSSVEEQFKGTSKAHASTLILKMLTTKYDGVSGIREHIMMMSDMANKLKGMDMEISEGFLVHFIMTSLPMQFGPFKINYNTQKEKWKMSELIAMCVQEEERLKVEKPDCRFMLYTNSIREWLMEGQRMTRLVKDEVLPDLDFSDFEKCVECIKGKMTKGNKKGVTRSTELLELIHIKICGPFPSGIGGHKSFITFIDDYSRYMYLFLINEKSESLDMFKTFKAEVENHLDRKNKVVRSDRGGEYYGRHTDVGQAPGSFFDFCKDHGIINQYTMPGTPKQNGVAERRNRTLMDMVRSIVPSKSVPKTPYEIWTGRKPAVLIFEERSKGYRFYCLSHSTRIVETRHAEFFENANNSRSSSFRRIELQEAQNEKPIMLEGTDYKETFSTVSRKDSLRIVMALIAHFDLELHQMDVKTAFLNRDLHEDVYYANHSHTPVIKGDVFESHQCPKTKVKYEEMKRIPYASVVGSLTYAQVCTRPDIAYICGMLGRLQSNPGLLHWKATKKVLRYLQGTKEYKLTYTRSDTLEVIGYSDSGICEMQRH
ncbi:retrovirus-related pol polyprotein from transposon TNT 1-94 [Tanacetum coccineum]